MHPKTFFFLGSNKLTDVSGLIGGLKDDLFVSSADDSKPESAPDDFSVNTKGNDGPEFWSDVRRIWRFVHFVAAWICVVVFVGWGFIKTDMNFRFGSMEIVLYKVRTSPL